jgi:hypothetical protein
VKKSDVSIVKDAWVNGVETGVMMTLSIVREIHKQSGQYIPNPGDEEAIFKRLGDEARKTVDNKLQ